jgi:hypothetical protein
MLSLFLAHAGAAHALEACLSHDGHSDHEFESHHSNSEVAASHDHSQTPSWPVIHCPSAKERLGPALQILTLKLSRLNEVALVRASVPPGAASRMYKNGLWLAAIFKRLASFALPNDLSRHLFLSVLQI